MGQQVGRVGDAAPAGLQPPQQQQGLQGRPNRGTAATKRGPPVSVGLPDPAVSGFNHRSEQLSMLLFLPVKMSQVWGWL
ncbi:Abelson tyrosine-protein kinase 2 isoform X1 [Arapaima gigas]